MPLMGPGVLGSMLSHGAPRVWECHPSAHAVACAKVPEPARVWECHDSDLSRGRVPPARVWVAILMTGKKVRASHVPARKSAQGG